MDTLFCVKTSDQLGRHGIALKNLQSGSVFISEIPFAYGPKSGTPIICLVCCRNLNIANENARCPKCKWPLCEVCMNSELHNPECDIFTSARAVFGARVDSNQRCPQLDCVTPLRVLLKKEYDPERWESDVEPMEYHDTARRNAKDEWNADLNNVAKYLRGPCKLTRFSEKLIMRVIGILQVNAFEARTPQGYPLRCLFPQTGILAHSCVPNTIRTIYPSDEYRIKVRALVDIEEDDQLFVSYTYILDGTAERQQHLIVGKYFKCHCPRCLDPTELGTHFSSIKCDACDLGYLTIINPIDNSSDWKCDKCDYISSWNKINQILEPIQNEVNIVDSLPYSESRLDCTEKLLRKNSGILHPMHYVQTNLRQSLIQMYGRVNNYTLSSLPDYLLEYKIELCRQVLKVLDVFEPGISRSRATMLYELHAPLALIAKRYYISGSLNTDEYKLKLQEAILILQEAVSIFQNEDPSSLEGSLAKVGEKGIEQLQATAAAI